jgi:hypothetical protein
MAKILVDHHITPKCFELESPSTGSYFLCLVEICLYVLHTNLVWASVWQQFPLVCAYRITHTLIGTAAKH